MKAEALPYPRSSATDSAVMPASSRHRLDRAQPPAPFGERHAEIALAAPQRRAAMGARLGTFSFRTPLMGIVLGAWLPSEPIEPAFLAGAAMVLAGIVPVSGHGRL